MQPAFSFEQSRLDDEAAARFEAAKAELRRKLSTRIERTRRKKQESIEKNVRKWRREAASRARHDKDRLWAACGINLYNGQSWSHCVKCGQPLTYTDLDTAHRNRRECVRPAPAPL